MGWESLVIWECEMKELDLVRGRLATFLGPPKAGQETRKA